MSFRRKTTRRRAHRAGAVLALLAFAMASAGALAEDAALTRADLEPAPAAATEAGTEAGTGPGPGREVPDALDLFRGDVDDVGDPVADDIDRQVNLGRIQRANGEYDVAVRTLEAALARIRDEYGIWDPRNVSALSELAAAQRGLGNLDAATGLYEEAVHVNRVNEGLHDVTQIDMLDALTELKAELGEWEEADQLQEYAFYVQQREYGATPALVPGLYRLANWHRRTGAVLQARMLYETAVEILENAYGPEDMRLVDALHGIATTYRLERYPITTRAQRAQDDNFTISTGATRPTRGFTELEDSRVVLNRYGDGEEALARIVQILQANPEVSARELAQAMLDLADWYLIFDKWNDAFETYARTREVLDAAGWDESRMGSLFGEPTPLVFPLPEPPNAPGYTADLVERRGYVDLTYDITDRGRVRSIDVVAADPEGMMDFRTRKAVKAARFRPRFVGGEPVETTGVQYRHSFVYYRPAEG